MLQVLQSQLAPISRLFRCLWLWCRSWQVLSFHVVRAILQLGLIECLLTGAWLFGQADLFHVQSRLDSLEYGTNHLCQGTLGDLLVGGAARKEEDIVDLAHGLEQTSTMDNNLIVEDRGE